jgi:hypothetical protein
LNVKIREEEAIGQLQRVSWQRTELTNASEVAQGGLFGTLKHLSRDFDAVGVPTKFREAHPPLASDAAWHNLD